MTLGGIGYLCSLIPDRFYDSIVEAVGGKPLTILLFLLVLVATYLLIPHAVKPKLLNAKEPEDIPNDLPKPQREPIEVDESEFKLSPTPQEIRRNYMAQPPLHRETFGEGYANVKVKWEKLRIQSITPHEKNKNVVRIGSIMSGYTIVVAVFVVLEDYPELKNVQPHTSFTVWGTIRSVNEIVITVAGWKIVLDEYDLK